MKIALVAPPFVAVPPTGYGGTERILDYLGRALVDKGVDTTLYASGDSKTSVPVCPIVQTSLFNDASYDHATQRADRMREINQRTVDLIEGDTDLINCHDMIIRI